MIQLAIPLLAWIRFLSVQIHSWNKRQQLQPGLKNLCQFFVHFLASAKFGTQSLKWQLFQIYVRLAFPVSNF